MSATLDPFKNYYAAVNLDLECWEAFRRDPALLAVVDEVRIILNQGLIACVPKTRLWEIGFDVAADLDKNAVFIQEQSHEHWAAIAVCMLSRAYIEIFRSNDPEAQDPMIRFYRTESNREEPLYVAKLKGQMKQVQVKGKNCYEWVPKEPEPVVPTQSQLSLF